MTTLQEVRDQHIPSFRRKRLGQGAISGRPLFATMVKCSCGWECTVNQPKRGAERDWKEHTREAWEKLRNPATQPDTGTPSVAEPGAAPDAAWNDYQRWQKRQEAVKSCPCCGHKGFWRQGDRKEMKIDTVSCGGCGLLMQGTSEPGSALDKWNQRT